MTGSAPAALPFGLDEEADVLATAPHVLGDVDLLVACIDGVEDPRRECGFGSLVGGVETLEAPHGGRVGHVSLPAKSVGVPAASELHVLSLTSVTRNAKIMGELGTELRTAWQQPRSPVTPTLSQESWCSDIMPHAYNLGDKFAWTGPQGKGAMKIRREVKRAEAEARAATAGPVQGCTSCFSRHDINRTCPPTVEQRMGRAA